MLTLTVKRIWGEAEQTLDIPVYRFSINKTAELSLFFEFDKDILTVDNMIDFFTNSINDACLISVIMNGNVLFENMQVVRMDSMATGFNLVLIEVSEWEWWKDYFNKKFEWRC